MNSPNIRPLYKGAMGDAMDNSESVKRFSAMALTQLDHHRSSVDYFLS
jgi:hypothetical protein